MKYINSIFKLTILNNIIVGTLFGLAVYIVTFFTLLYLPSDFTQNLNLLVIVDKGTSATIFPSPYLKVVIPIIALIYLVIVNSAKKN